ncbi:hypothetical protein SARC_09979 [Sphaeroforma arctica JP610]|uniref:Uncharacterized protein n=1 Tax=Sphaeroforma arctica JP610 TaxID=667725 RepID=A0A0L0FLB8_9EUKA|nr:hypothetical protein SARC_09979 [Sphaeroforma arctica JP610]KNC77562.1 hypothetical protein SARC_09979 [Sphaeroforma arctica JP610]|eukprot:XP_014151464.1 hypothetical protein SARC_09979 [Sphaeroforma arctica JP610]
MSMQFQTQPQTQPSDKKTTTTNTTTTTTTTTTPHTIRKDTQDAPQSRKQDSATQNDPKSAPKSGPGPEVGNKLIGRLDAYEPIAEVSDETSSLTALSEAEAYNEDMSRTPLGTRYIRAGGGSTATTTTTTSTTTSATFAKNQSQNPNQSPNQSPFTDERLPTTPLAYPFSAHLLDDMPQRRERAHSHNISSQSEEKRPTQRRLSNVQSFNAGVRMMSMNALVASMDEINTNVNLAELNANVHHVVDDEKTEGEDEEELEYAPPPARLRGPSLAELSEVFRRKSIADVGSSISQFNQQRLADSAVANEIIEEDSGLDLTEEQV